MDFNLTELLGGLGMFILGMSMLSGGLRMAAGPALENILTGATNTPMRAVSAGALVTALVQSSNVITVAAIGFVNANLLALNGALWILFGASIGSMSTGWIVAVAGLDLDFSVLALPMIAVGVAMQVAKRDHRTGYFGEALAGFGLLIYGILLMQAGFSDSATEWRIPEGAGLWPIVLQFMIGFLMTVLMQSSSASTALAITAAQAGMIDIEAAAMVIIGANLGSSVTAVLAMIGGTPNAKRVALAHVIFHVVGTVIGFVLLPLLMWLTGAITDLFSLDEAPAMTLAIFNTVFKLSGMAVMWPWVNWLSRQLKNWFEPDQKKASIRPLFLDKTTLPVPALAAVALGQEVARMVSIGWTYVSSTLSQDHDPGKCRRDLFGLLKASQTFVDEMSRGLMDEATSERIAMLLRVRRYLENVLELVFETLQLPVDVLESDALQRSYPGYLRCLESLIDQNIEGTRDPEEVQRFDLAYQQLKSALLLAGAGGVCSVTEMEEALHRISAQRRAVQQMTKAHRWLNMAMQNNAAPTKALQVEDEETI